MQPDFSTLKPFGGDIGVNQPDFATLKPLVEQNITPQPIQVPTIQKVGSVIDAIFGGGKIGEAIGTGIGYLMTPEEDRKYYDTSIPTSGQIFGSALQSAALFTPVGKLTGLIGKGLTKLGLKTGTKLLSNVGAGALAGEAFDVSSNLQQGKTGVEALKPGLMTGIGAGLPLVPPLVKGVTRGVAESLGVSTGAGYGSIKQLFNASAKGGAAKKAALDALRGNTTPTQIVDEAKNALGQIKNSRTNSYVTALSQLKENKKSFDITPVIDSVKENLNRFGIHVGRDGVIDFSRSPLRFNTTAQKDITTIVDTMKDFGSRQGDRTVIGLDSLKRAFGDLYTPSGEARAFITSVENSVRKVLSEVPGYDVMAENYATKTRLINDIQKSLSLGDKASIDTAFKKLTTVLKTNNEERKILVDELNAISDGKLVPMIAGQQMSEILPRGIARQIEGFGALGSIMAGFGTPILKMALFASPRVVGELVNALGIGKQAGNKLLDILGVKGIKLISPGDRLLQTKAGQKLEQNITNYVKNPKLGATIEDVSQGVSNQSTQANTKNITKNTISPNPTTEQSLMQEGGLTKKQQGTLAAVHNLTAEKAKFSNKIGGLANPSIGIIKPSMNKFEGYGDISLIADKDFLFSGRGKTYAADVYSPRFPNVTTRVKNYSQFEKALNDYGIPKNVLDDENIFRNIYHSDEIKKAFEKQKDQFKDFDSFVDGFVQDAGVEIQIFKGYTPMGNRQYVRPVTAEKVSKIMNKEEQRGGENFFYGLGSVRAKVAPRFKSVSQIKKAEPKIISSEDFNVIKDQYNKDFDTLLDDANKYYKYDKNSFGSYDDIGRALGEYISGRSGALGEIMTEIPTSFKTKLDLFAKKLAEMPTEYFETKFKRPVDLDEFNHAVVPEGTPQSVLDLFEKKGVTVSKYKKGEGNQTKEVLRAAAEKGLLFGLGALVFYETNK